MPSRRHSPATLSSPLSPFSTMRVLGLFRTGGVRPLTLLRRALLVVSRLFRSFDQATTDPFREG